MSILVERVLGAILPRIFSSPTKDMLVVFSTPSIPDDSLVVASKAFGTGEQMPWKYGGEGVGDNVCPDLSVSQIPPEAESLVVIMEDLDVPLPNPITHMVCYGIKPEAGGTVSIGEGVLNSVESSKGFATFGKAYKGTLGYRGPRPLVNHGKHNYYFEVFALGKLPEPLPEQCTLQEVVEVIKDHGLAKGHTYGWFERTTEKYAQ